MFKYHNDLICFNQTTIAHDEDNLFILDKHCTNEGTWSLFQVTGGELYIVLTDGEGNELSRHYLNPVEPPMLIPPATWHRIEPVSEHFYAEFEFYCKPHRFFQKKHAVSDVHGDLLYAYQAYLSGQGALNILDIGCGAGRNTLYLALNGHELKALDIKQPALNHIEHLAHTEHLDNLQTIHHDLNMALTILQDEFDFIFSTVSLQFLNPARIPGLLSELRNMTQPMGIHLMVFPIKSDKFPLPDTFLFLPDSEELLHNYQDAGWSILEYKENVGKLHKNDSSGRPIQGIFAFLLAQNNQLPDG